MNAHDNEIVDVYDLRGAVGKDLHDAFKEWEFQAASLTRAKKYLYSLSINPDPNQAPLTRKQYLDLIARTEKALGLEGQPRAVVFHTKDGRDHCHVAWSRTDVENRRAVHLAHDHRTLMMVARSFARDQGLDLPDGYDHAREAPQLSRYEKEKERRSGMTREDHIREVTEAWSHSDDAKSFVQALSERGYLLARGDRPYVLVDLYGGVTALPRLIADKSVNTKALEKFLAKDFPSKSLPSVAEAQKLVAGHRAMIDRALHEDLIEVQLGALRHAQGERKREVLAQRAALGQKHETQRVAFGDRLRKERDALRERHLAQTEMRRLARVERTPTGLVSFLGRVTGISKLRAALGRREDAKLLKALLAERKALKLEQARETRLFELRLKVQMQTADRHVKSLEAVDKREIAAMKRDLLAQSRTRQREDSGIPSLEALVRPSTERDGLKQTFTKASGNVRHAPDIARAFDDAANGREIRNHHDSAAGDRGGPDLSNEPDADLDR